jgi:hypothetical protein
LRRWAITPAHEPRNRSLGDLKAELLQFSPWIRGAPQSGFAAAICTTSVRMA